MTVVDNRVVVGIGGSAHSLAAVDAAARLAAVTGRALVAVTAWTDTGRAYSPQRNPALGLGSPCAQAQRLLHAMVDDLPSALDVEIHAICGAAGPVLVQMAGMPDDLLVLGIGSRRRFGRLSSGAVARYCLDHARCPVLMVPERRVAQGRRGESLAAHAKVIENAIAYPLPVAAQGSKR